MIMILGIGKEVSVFLQALLAGNQVCLFYYAIRVFRRILKHKLFWISLEDILFWIGTAIYLFVRIYQTCNGSIRWYFVIGVFGGMLITYFIVEKIAKKYVARLLKK